MGDLIDSGCHELIFNHVLDFLDGYGSAEVHAFIDNCLCDSGNFFFVCALCRFCGRVCLADRVLDFE